MYVFARPLSKPPPRLTAPQLGCYDDSAGWSSLVARWAHNPKVGGSNPPPATNLKFLPLNHLKLSAGSLQYHNRLPLQAINPRKAVLPCSDIILEKKVRQGLNKDRRSMEIPMVRLPRLWSSLILSIAFCLVNGANTALAQSPDQPWINTRLSPEKRAELVLTQMTLAEKIALLHGNGMQHAPQWQMPLTSISNGGAGYVEECRG